MKESIELIETFNVLPPIIYNAWLDTEKHTQMTGGAAFCTNQVGERFTAWDGYITGKNLKLIDNQLIIQSWKTSEFDSTDEDSKLEIRLSKITNGTQLTLIHTNIPQGQLQYKKGWIEHYFTPMKEYFKELRL